jgi:MoxR-like ATPase
MAEKQVTIWNQTFKLPQPFIVLATQNPIEQAWTYNLPEAQLDRFMMKVNVDYADKNTEKEIYKRLNQDYENIKIEKVLNKEDILNIQELLKKIHVSDAIYDYVTKIIDATRHPKNYELDKIKNYIVYGVSPRWGISLIAWAKANAFMEWRDFVLPEDVKKLALDTLGHRIILTYEAIADWITEKDIIKEILDKVPLV